MSWFRIRGEDGHVERSASAPKKASGAFETHGEEILYSVLALAPELIEAKGEFPLVLFGGQGTPDQQMVDQLGRRTLVECKKQRATLKDLVQLLGYGYVEFPSSYPIGDYPLAFTTHGYETYGAALAHATCPSAAKQARAVLSADKASEILARTKALEAALGAKNAGAVGRLGRVVGERLFGPAWSLLTGGTASPTVRAAAKWNGAAPIPGAPLRLVLVAPSFDDDCRRQAALLAGRGVWLDLIALDVRLAAAAKGISDVYVRCDDVGQRCDAFHHLWPAVRHLHEAKGCERFRAAGFYPWGKGGVGWGYDLETAPDVSFSLGVKSTGEAEVFLRLEHGAFDGQPAVRSQRQRQIRGAV